MTRTSLVAILALVPALATAQFKSLEQARDAGRVSDEGNARIERIVDDGDAAPKADAAAPGPAAAPGVPVPGDAAPLDDAALGVAPVDVAAAAADGAPATGAPPDTYTVRPGDTLWDLSGRFLNNPWYWPKIWSYNPEITNPHWIYPGNVVKFYASADEAPTRVEPVPGVPGSPELPVATATPDEDEPEPVAELEDLSKADLKAPASIEEQDAVAVAGPYKIAYVPPKAIHARHDTFVTPQELAESGAISAAFEEKIMLASLDSAYAHFQGDAEVQVGETYVVYKTERPIRHPVTKELFGYQSTVLGSAKVVAVSEKAATLKIVQSFEPIERGALLGPWGQKFFRAVARKPNKQAVDGRIIAAQVDVVTQMGEHHVVFVDKGESDGVEEGNVFQVVRSGDLYDRPVNEPAWDESLPTEVVGDLLVIDVKEKGCTALVTRSLKELVIGDRVEMRAAADADAGSAGN